MNFLSLVLLGFLCLALPAHATGGHVGNGGKGSGGDAIDCRASQENFLRGRYSLDYVLTLESAREDKDLAPVRSWNASAERIARILQSKLPTMAPYFEEFRQTAFNTKDYSKARIWEPAPFGLVDLNDENIVTKVPANCKVGGETKVIQAVVRQNSKFSGSDPRHIIYSFVPEVVAELDRQSPVQLSFLMVHEWLWDFSTNVERNRRVNRLLHSKRIEKMSAAELAANLKGMGFFIPGEQPEVFSAASCQGNRISEQDLRARYGSSYTFTRNLGSASFYSRARSVRCAEKDESCDGLWGPSPVPNHYIDNFPFFGAISWDRNDLSFPIHLLSPSLFESSGMLFKPGLSQIACRFISSPDANLECQVRDDKLVWSLGGRSSEDVPYENWPKLYGVFTDECMRVSSRFYRKNDVVGDGVRGSEVREYENVFFVKYKYYR